MNKHIHIGTIFYMAWKNISSKKLRSFLTVFGIIIGIGSIAFLVSFGLGLQRLVTKNVIGDKSIKSIEVTTPNSRVIKLNDIAVNKIRQFPHIDKAGLAYSFPASIGLQGGGVDSVLYGVDQNYQELTTLNLMKGRLLRPTDNKTVLVSSAALKAIGLDPVKALNKRMDIAVPLQYADPKLKELKDSFTIVGVIDSGSNNEIFVGGDVFTVAGVPTYKEMKIITDDTKNIASLRKQIEASGFQTTSPIDTLAQINQLFKFFNIILAGFGGIGIIVAILGMFNTLTISLLERTKEIGLMITLGGRTQDMRRLFMFEAVILSIFGALNGVVLSFVSGRVVNFVINQNAASRINERFDIFYMPWWLIGVLVGFMLSIGLLVSYFPARRAQKINPIDALRRE